MKGTHILVTWLHSYVQKYYSYLWMATSYVLCMPQLASYISIICIMGIKKHTTKCIARHF